MGKGMTLQPVTITSMITEKMEVLAAANPGNTVYLTTEPALTECEVHGILRREKAAQGTSD
jgi:hypothetical protein